MVVSVCGELAMSAAGEAPGLRKLGRTRHGAVSIEARRAPQGKGSFVIRISSRWSFLGSSRRTSINLSTPRRLSESLRKKT